MTVQAVLPQAHPRGGVLLAAVLTGFVACTYGFGVYLFASLVVDMRRDLGFDYTTVGLITGTAQAGFLVFSFATGNLARRFTGGRIALASTLTCACSLLGLAASDNLWLSAALLVVLGGCSASAYIPLAEIVARRYPANRRARVMGLISSGTSYGVFINGLLVSLVMGSIGWRGVWLVAGGLSLLLCAVAWPCLRETPEHDASRVETPRPVGDAWFGTPVLMTWVVAFLNGVTLLPFQTYLVPHMRDGLGLAAQTAGMVWSTIGAVGMVAGFAVGWVADAIGVRYALSVCFASAALAAGCVFMSSSTPPFFVAGVLFALAFYPVFGLVPSYLARIVPLTRLTQAFGIANVLIGLGGISGNVLGGVLRDLSGSFALLYLVIAVLLVVQGVLVLRLPERRER